ncbi:OTU deubiquitinase with linear linkage specificity b isoform X1, partial [Tachysurus ichikawai]
MRPTESCVKDGRQNKTSAGTLAQCPKAPESCSKSKKYKKGR